MQNEIAPQSDTTIVAVTRIVKAQQLEHLRHTANTIYLSSGSNRISLVLLSHHTGFSITHIRYLIPEAGELDVMWEQIFNAQ